jgi:uncharacterized Zn-binding protein involved in type VI secretion
VTPAERTKQSSGRFLSRKFKVAVITGLIGVALVAVVCAFAASDGSAPEEPQTFTLAHRTVWAAVQDFFGYRPAPVQPIAYTHKVHLAHGMQCTTCHVGVDRGPDARIPSVTFCMTCHQVIAKDNPEIKKMAAYRARGEEIPWQRVYGFETAANVKFNHAPHIRAGIDCAKCHGDMHQQTVAERKVDHTMGFCVQCHQQTNASIDCVTCHF